MTNMQADALLLTTATFFISCDLVSGEGWTGMMLLQLLIAAALLALLLGDLGLVHGL